MRRLIKQRTSYRIRPRLLSGFLATLICTWLPLEDCTAQTRLDVEPTASAKNTVEKFQCHRCHTISDTLKEIPFEQNCVNCHQQILLGKLDSQYTEDATTRWKKHIRHFIETPTLEGLSSRMRRDWFIQFVQKPHVVRPRYLSTMPRMNISFTDATLLADFWFPSVHEIDTTPLDVSLVPKGRKLYLQHNCGTCHLFTGVDASNFEPPVFTTRLPVDPVLRNAPDLIFTRSRMTVQQFHAWMRNPQAVKKDALMPRITLSEEDISALASFVLSEPPSPSKAPAELAIPPVLDRQVRYQEVETKVFKAVCWHCHSDPAKNGDGGPGNTGGFGYAGKGLDLGSYQSVLRGSLQKDGTYRSLLSQNSEGVPILLSHVLARHNEVRNGEFTQVLGMPLGLPPLSIEQIQILRTWIAQGAKN